MPGLTRYGYRNAISGFFEFPTENARRILPRHLEPVELHHGTSIFSMTAFDFNESMVGEYGEVVMSVIVSPLVKPGERLPKSAFYPYLVATTTKAAREHAIERWHLPHWMADVEIEFVPAPGHDRARARGRPARGGDDHQRAPWSPEPPLPVLHEGRRPRLPGPHHHGGRAERARGREGADQALRPSLQPGPGHPRGLRVPFRELWMREGRQTFEPLVELETA